MIIPNSSIQASHDEKGGADSDFNFKTYQQINGNIHPSGPTDLGQGLDIGSFGLDTLRNLSLPVHQNFMNKSDSRGKYTCSQCGGKHFSFSDGGALLSCKDCGNILRDHIENVE